MSDAVRLYWSKPGHVACEKHVPRNDDALWITEGWEPLPEDFPPDRFGLQCEACSDKYKEIAHAPTAILADVPTRA